MVSYNFYADLQSSLEMGVASRPLSKGHPVIKDKMTGSSGDCSLNLVSHYQHFCVQHSLQPPGIRSSH